MARNVKPEKSKYGIILEKKVANFLYYKGYAVIRSAGSGRGKRRPEPDLIVIKDGKAVAIELTYRSNKRNIGIPTYHVQRLKEFIDKAKIKMLLCVKYSREEIKCIDYSYIFNELKNFKLKYITVPAWKIEKEGKDLITAIEDALRS